MADVTYTVQYDIGTYSGTIRVVADENADSDHVLALAKRSLVRRAGPLPMGLYYQSFKILSVVDPRGPAR